MSEIRPKFVDVDGTEYHVSPRTAQMIRVCIAKAGRIRALKVVQVTLDVRGDSVGCRVTEIDPPQAFTSEESPSELEAIRRRVA